MHLIFLYDIFILLKVNIYFSFFYSPFKIKIFNSLFLQLIFNILDLLILYRQRGDLKRCLSKIAI
nr:MAG TPA: hypothetical protein [Caudoviricetes sp.]